MKGKNTDLSVCVCKYIHFIESLPIEIDESQQFDTGIMEAFIAIWFDDFLRQSHCYRIQFRWFDLWKSRNFRNGFM